MRSFCHYSRADNEFFIGTGDVEGTVPIEVDKCVQRFSDTTGRRHCFEVTAVGGQTYTLQAVDDAARHAWVCSMGGLAPKKTIRMRAKGGSGTATEGLTDRGLTLLQRLVTHIEMNGSEEEGIYRLPGVKTYGRFRSPAQSFLAPACPPSHVGCLVSVPWLPRSTCTVF